MPPTGSVDSTPLELNLFQLLGADLKSFGRQLYGTVAPPQVSPSTAAVLIGNILQVAFGFLAIVFIIMVLYAGFEWMTSKGDAEKIEKHKTALIHATLGLLLALAAYSFTRLFVHEIFSKLVITPL